MHNISAVLLLDARGHKGIVHYTGEHCCKRKGLESQMWDADQVLCAPCNQSCLCFKGLITVMPRGKSVQRADGWLESWFPSKTVFDVAAHTVLRKSRLAVKSWSVPACTDCTPGSKCFTVLDPLRYSTRRDLYLILVSAFYHPLFCLWDTRTVRNYLGLLVLLNVGWIWTCHTFIVDIILKNILSIK